MKLPAVLLLAAPVGIAANDPQPGCKCKAQPLNAQQAQAPGKPAYPGNALAYGWGCKAHDSRSEQMFVVGWNGTTCDTADTSPGQDADWCEDIFCIVDPNACDVRYLKLSYTANTNDWFSYEACYDGMNNNFTGNGWVGRCQNCPTHLAGTAGLVNSYCACHPLGKGGKDECMCVATPTDADPYPAQQEANIIDKNADGTNKYPDYPGVNLTAYGWGCKAHDDTWDVCDGSTPTTDGAANDWCKDKFCIVDTNKCTNNRNLKLMYSNEVNDYFSYETCDSTFAGNGWVGRCTGSQTADTTDMANSYYTCDPTPTPAPTASPSPSPSPSPDASLASQRGLAAVGATLLAAAIFQ